MQPPDPGIPEQNSTEVSSRSQESEDKDNQAAMASDHDTDSDYVPECLEDD